MIYRLYVISLFFAAFVGLSLAIYAWRRRQVAARRPFIALMVTAIWWGIFAGLSAIVPSVETAVLLGIPFRLTAVVAISPLILIFTLAYTGQTNWLQPRRLILLLIIPFISEILGWTGAWHQLFVYDVVYEQTHNIWLRTSWSQGPWFQFVYLPYNYLALSITFILLFNHVRYSQYPYRQQALLAFIGSLPPIGAGLLTVLDILPGPDLDLVILAFIFMGFLFAWSLFGYQMLNITPIARDIIVENMADGVIVVNTMDRIIDVNQTLENVLGQSRRQIIGQPLAELLSPWPNLLTEYSKPTPINRVITIETTHGLRYLDIHISSIQNQGQQLGRLIIWRDITHDKQTELALQNSLQKIASLYKVAQSLSGNTHLTDLFQTIVDSVADALPADRVTLIGFDQEKQQITDFVYGGLGATQVVKVSYEELMLGLSGWVLQELKPALSPKGQRDPRESQAVYQRRLETNCGAIIVVPLQYRGTVFGTITAINQPKQPDFVQADVELMQAMGNQITVAIENAELYEKERQRVLNLQESNEALQAFSYTVAHDLRTPLAGITGYVALLQEYRDRGMLSETQLDRYLDLILQTSYKMTEIINSLMMLAQVQKQQTIPIEQLAMSHIVQEALKRLDWQIQLSQAHITVADSWPMVSGHALWVEEIWVNYISNAIKYGGQPPIIHLGVDSQPITNGRQHQQIRFWVQDNGKGLTSEQQTRLFREFSQVGQNKAEGYGLGLSIVRRIVERLGGDVSVESKVGEGSLFYFSLPVATIED